MATVAEPRRTKRRPELVFDFRRIRVAWETSMLGRSAVGYGGGYRIQVYRDGTWTYSISRLADELTPTIASERGFKTMAAAKAAGEDDANSLRQVEASMSAPSSGRLYTSQEQNIARLKAVLDAVAHQLETGGNAADVRWAIGFIRESLEGPDDEGTPSG
jgi:hypothetical protein